MLNMLSRIRRALDYPAIIAPFLRDRINSLFCCSGIIHYPLMPGSIKLYVNTTCNASCPMCDIGTNTSDSVFFRQLSAGQASFLSEETCKKIAAEMGAFSPRLCISGVEPLLHPELGSIIKTLKDAGLFVSLSTNGILLEASAGMLAASGIDEIIISLDGTEEVHDFIRGPGVYRKVISGINRLNKAIASTRDCRTRIRINCCISDRNYAFIYNLAEEVFTFPGIDSLLFTYMYFVTGKASAEQYSRFPSFGEASASQMRNVDLASINTDILWRQVSLLKALPYQHRIHFNIDMKSIDMLHKYFHEPELTLNSRRCTIPWRSATILVNGDCIIHNRCIAYITGNILKTSFRDIWTGKAYRGFRQTVSAAGTFPVCARCCGVIAGA